MLSVFESISKKHFFYLNKIHPPRVIISHSTEIIAYSELLLTGESLQCRYCRKSWFEGESTPVNDACYKGDTSRIRTCPNSYSACYAAGFHVTLLPYNCK